MLASLKTQQYARAHLAAGPGKTVEVASELSALLTDTLRQAHINTHRTLSFQVNSRQTQHPLRMSWHSLEHL